MSTVTNAGRTELANLFGNSNSPAEFIYLAWGTGTTAEGAAQTALVTEVDREEAVQTRMSLLSPFDTIRFLYLFTAAAAATVAEVALLNASSGGDMLVRHLLTPAKAVGASGRVGVNIDVCVKDGGNNGGSGW